MDGWKHSMDERSTRKDGKLLSIGTRFGPRACGRSRSSFGVSAVRGTDPARISDRNGDDCVRTDGPAGAEGANPGSSTHKR